MTFMSVILSVLLLVATATATPIPTYGQTNGPTSCADYPDNFFVNDNFTCQGYLYCANGNSEPLPGMCIKPYNFDQVNQKCSHPDTYPCSVSFGDNGDYAKVAVSVHNEFRRRHGVPNVASFSSDINQFAQRWAEHLASTGQLYHSGGPYGENLYMAYGGITDRNVIMANAIKTFYNEIHAYNWGNPGFSMKTGHFTQVVWKSSTEIGVGIATNKGRTAVCINYRPRGNVQGQFRQNVLPPKASLDDIIIGFNSTFTNDDVEEPFNVEGQLYRQNVLSSKASPNEFKSVNSTFTTDELEPFIVLVL